MPCRSLSTRLPCCSRLRCVWLSWKPQPGCARGGVPRCANLRAGSAGHSPPSRPGRRAPPSSAMAVDVSCRLNGVHTVSRFFAPPICSKGWGLRGFHTDTQGRVVYREHCARRNFRRLAVRVRILAGVVPQVVGVCDSPKRGSRALPVAGSEEHRHLSLCGTAPLRGASRDAPGWPCLAAPKLVSCVYPRYNIPAHQMARLPPLLLSLGKQQKGEHHRGPPRP